MRVQVGQIYIQPGVEFPFSHHFQAFLATVITKLVRPSAKFIEQYANDYELMFNISAKKRIHKTQVKGPTVFKRAKDVEYSVFLPFDVIMRTPDVLNSALRFLMKGIYNVLESLEIDTTALREQEDFLIQRILSEPTMLEEED